VSLMDVLDEILQGRITVDDAYQTYDSVMEGSGNPEQMLGLSSLEWTAFCQGVGLGQLAFWRRDGWPAECVICGRELDPEAFSWMAVERQQGHAMAHLGCLSSTR
jgi:hypothetical protein